MADVSVYKRCTQHYFTAGQVIALGEIRVATDPIVVANPGLWVALTDAELTAGVRKVHS